MLQIWCYVQHVVEVLLLLKQTGFEKIHGSSSSSVAFSTPLDAFHLSLGFIGKNKTSRSLRKTWEREILWTSCKYRVLGKEKFVENVLEDLTNTNFIEVCRSVSGEGNEQPLLLLSSVVTLV